MASDEIQDMTNRYTQAEWSAIVTEAEKDIPSAFPEYKAPILGTSDFAQCIDHTLLKLDANQDQVDELCEEARRYHFRSVCVRLKWVERAVRNLQGSGVVVACVVGFHEGTNSVSDKVKEASQAISAGAFELDMVMNYPLLKQQKYSQVYTDVAAIRNMAPHPIVLKVILETAQLTQFDIIAGCKVSDAANADFVKTSTGFGGQGATVENVRLMKSIISPHMKVKASGGVKTVNECVSMTEAGAERIGTSNGVWIMKEALALLEDTTHAAGGNQDRQNITRSPGWHSSNAAAWDQQTRKYCGQEAKFSNGATGKSMLLFIGDSFAQPWSGGAIDIVIGAAIEFYGSDPNGNHDLVMNPVDWELIGHIDPAYTADGAGFQTDSSGNTAITTEAGNINPSAFYGPATLRTTTRGKSTIVNVYFSRLGLRLNAYHW